MECIRVLLVDDHPVVREGLRTMLETADDIEVVGEAGDGLEALEQAPQVQPHVVLMDLRMPEMGGLEATWNLRREYPAVKVVVLTVYDNDAYVVDAVRAGARGYLLKDASRDLLIHTIRAVNSGATLFKTSLLQQAMASLRAADSGVAGEESVEAELPGRFHQYLTPREQEVLQLMVEGRTNKQIAAALVISEDTAKKHVQSIIAKLGAADRTEAAVKAVRAGLVP